jgi:predicted SAM-dependent methyltransferase
VLEHLALDDFRLALKNTYRILKPGGVFRLVMPDLRAMVQQYVAAGNDPRAAMDFMEHSGLGRQNRARGLIGNIRAWLGNSRHRWLWDYESLEPELKNAGFVDVRPAAYGDYADKYFATVEFPDRFPSAVAAESM